MLNNLPILFFINKDNSNLVKNPYKIFNISSLLKKYNLTKNLYFMFYYSDLYILDLNFILDCKQNNKKVLDFLDLNKKFFLFVYYNNKFYNYISMSKFIKLYLFKYNKFFYFLNFKNKNKKLLSILIYFKKKKCLV